MTHVLILKGNLNRDGDFLFLHKFVREFEKIETTHGLSDQGMICTKKHTQTMVRIRIPKQIEELLKSRKIKKNWNIVNVL